jgi:hypothetical protein
MGDRGRDRAVALRGRGTLGDLDGYAGPGATPVLRALRMVVRWEAFPTSRSSEGWPLTGRLAGPTRRPHPPGRTLPSDDQSGRRALVRPQPPARRPPPASPTLGSAVARSRAARAIARGRRGRRSIGRRRSCRKCSWPVAPTERAESPLRAAGARDQPSHDDITVAQAADFAVQRYGDVRVDRVRQRGDLSDACLGRLVTVGLL